MPQRRLNLQEEELAGLGRPVVMDTDGNLGRGFRER